MLQNGQMALDFLRYKKIKLVNIRAEDIVDGNPKLTLGLIWTIILHFQVSEHNELILLHIYPTSKNGGDDTSTIASFYLLHPLELRCDTYLLIKIFKLRG